MLIRHAFPSVRFPGLFLGISLLLTAVARGQSYAYTIGSEPSGYVNQSGVVASGTVVTTPLAAEAVSGTIFGYWRVNGSRQAGGDGVAPRQVNFTVTGTTTVTAVYFPATADTDTDGVPDWYEWRQFGGLAQGGSYDPDGDGFGAAVESWRRYSPVLVDTVIDGGVASRRSAKLTFVASGNFAYTIGSEPSGYVNQSGVVASGTVVTTPLAAEAVSGTIFGYWRVNGVRQADGAGVAPRQVNFTVTGATTATAMYFPATADTDADGVPDWYEWRQFGGLAQGGSYDPDGDGFGAAVESWRRYSPVLVDTVIDGGVASRRSAKLTFVASGNYAYTIGSEPSGYVNQSGVVASGTVVTTPLAAEAVSGTIFGYWRVNGVRQADGAGVAPRQVNFTVTGTTTVTAMYFPATADADADGVPDWYEWRQFGGMAQSGSYDPDDDGFGAAVESWRRYSPVLVDTVIDGGIASRRSVRISFVPVITSGYNAWATGKFTSSELADPAMSGPNAVYGVDGLPNLVKYALGLDPKSNVTVGLPETTTTITDWVYTYTRPADRADLVYVVEVSTNLTTWTTAGVTHALVLSSGGNQTWRASYPLSSASNIFFRLKVTQ